VSETASEALERVGLSPEQLLGICRDVGNTAARRSPYCSRETREALISYLTEVALKQVLKYDPARSGTRGSYTIRLHPELRLLQPELRPELLRLRGEWQLLRPANGAGYPKNQYVQSY
jgi:hypothetical protein